MNALKPAPPTNLQRGAGDLVLYKFGRTLLGIVVEFWVLTPTQTREHIWRYKYGTTVY